MNKVYYSVLYYITRGGTKNDTEKILFASPHEVTDDQIKAFIKERLRLSNAVVTLRSINKFNKETFIAIGGDPHRSFQ